MVAHVGTYLEFGKPCYPVWRLLSHKGRFPQAPNHPPESSTGYAVHQLGVFRRDRLSSVSIAELQDHARREELALLLLRPIELWIFAKPGTHFLTSQIS